jgi:hypothetical protein
MAHETMPLAAIRIVAARTRYEPHAICGTKSRTSIRKAKRDTIKVRMLSMNIASRYRGEWEGEWKWADAPRMSMMSVKNAAIGWTMRIAESVVLVPDGSSKLADCVWVNKFAVL